MLPSTSSHFDSNHLKQVAPVKRLFLQFLVRNVSLQKHLFKGFYLSMFLNIATIALLHSYFLKSEEHVKTDLLMFM